MEQPRTQDFQLDGKIIFWTADSRELDQAYALILPDVVKRIEVVDNNIKLPTSAYVPAYTSALGIDHRATRLGINWHQIEDYTYQSLLHRWNGKPSAIPILVTHKVGEASVTQIFCGVYQHLPFTPEFRPL